MKPNPEPIDTNDTAPDARKRWMGVLARAGTDQLKAALADLDKQPEYEYLRPPEIGMTMVRGRAGGKGEQFNLGEMTMTRCSIKMNNGHVGHGYIAGRDKPHAELAAIFDALLQSSKHGQTLLAKVIDPIESELKNNRQNQAAKIAATKVNFFTMVRGEN